MENNEDTNTNMMDLLPNEMVIKIFEYFENLADLLTLPKVNHRFNVLSKQKCSRNHLLFEEDEIAAYSYEEIQRKVEDEMNKCRDLKAVTYRTSLAINSNLKFKFWSIMKSMFIKSLNRNIEHEINLCDFDSLRMYDEECLRLYSFFKKSSGDMSRVVHMLPSDITSIFVNGTPKLFETAVVECKDTLKIVNYDGTNVTFAHLNALGKCKTLEFVLLRGKLVVCEEVPEIFPNIQSIKIILVGNFHCPYVADIFFSETLKVFHASYKTIAGFENELVTKCTNLKYLTINMEVESADVHDVQLVESITESVNILKYHGTLRVLNIMNINQFIHNSLLEPLSACIESVAGSEILDTSAYDLSHSDIYIELNKL